MALGRVSAFQKLQDKSGAGSGSSRENVRNSALQSPYARLAASDFTGGAGGANSSSANTSGITGGDPSLASMAAAVGTLGVPGLGAVTGPLGMSLAGPIGGLIGGLGGNRWRCSRGRGSRLGSFGRLRGLGRLGRSSGRRLWGARRDQAHTHHTHTGAEQLSS